MGGGDGGGAARIAACVAAALLLGGATLALAGGAGVLPPAFGVADDAPKFAGDGGAALYARLQQLGMGENRIAVDFDPAQPATIQEQAFLDRSVPVAAGLGVHLVFSVYPHAPSAFATDTDRRVALYADYLKLLARRYPQVREYMLLNEPNEAAFFAPQFGPDGANVSAATAFKALAAGYDALKSVDAGITVVGLGLSPEANDTTSTSPVRFLHALGAAYRRSGRTAPLMDELGLHVHPRDSSRFTEGTSYQWPNVGPADLDRIKQAVWDAFAGTGQPTFHEGPGAGTARELRLLLDEIGVQVGVLPSLASLYTGAENVAVTDEETQARVYAGLLRRFACDPNVAGALLFLLVDQRELPRFQSGLLRVDGSERPAYAAVRDAVARAAQCASTVSWTHTTGVLGGGATFDTADRPQGTGVVGLTVTAAEDANADAVLLPLADGEQPTPETVVAALRKGTKAKKLVRANFSPRLELRGRLRDGAYALGARLTSTVNQRRVSIFVGPVFHVGGAGLLPPRDAPELAAPLAADTRRARVGLAAIPRLGSRARQIDRDLAAGEREVELGARRVSAGQLCAGARDAAAGVRTLQRTGDVFDGAVAAIHAQLGREPNPGDADAADVLWHELDYRRGLVARVELDAQRVAQGLARLCAAVAGPRSVRSRIIAVDDTAHTLLLGNGTHVTLADAHYGEPFAEGSLVEAEGTVLKNGMLVATKVDAVDLASKAPVKQVKCLFFRIAPAPQAFVGDGPDIPAPDLLLHDPKGYLLGGKLWLEDAARLGVERKNCPQIAVGDTGPRFFVELELIYQDTYSKSKWDTLLGADVDGTEAPVAFPSTMDPFSDATLVVATRVHNCKRLTVKSLQCGISNVVDKQTYTVRVRRGPYFMFAYGKGAEWDGTAAYVDLDGLAPYRAVELKGLAPSVSQFILGGTGYSLQARGFLVTGASSSSPNVKTITPGTFFAAYSKPWSLGSTYPIFGLWDGRVDGTRNGKPFRYAVAQPQVVADVVTYCPSNIETSYYRLPWQSGLTIKVGQGNFGAFTHKGSQTYAFDFGLANGQAIYAPRGGVVTYVRENLTKNSNPNKNETWQPANALRIEHQDGSASWYMHMQPNGVLPVVGDFVKRGAKVAITGNTGNSTGPHLHYQVQSDPTEWAPSIQIRFQTNDANCVIPVTGGNYISNNS